MQRVFGYPGATAVGDELLGERRLLVRDDAGLDHRLRHVRPSDGVSAGDRADTVEVDRVAELLTLLDHQLPAPETRVRQPSELRGERLVPWVDPVREHVQAGAVVFGGEFDARNDLDAVAGSGRRFVEPFERVVIRDRDPGQTPLDGEIHHLRRRERAVGSVGVGMQVVAAHGPSMVADGSAAVIRELRAPA